jgi:Putative carbohydrate metabolism domain
MQGCVKEDYFGRSPLKKIIYFSLTGQVGNSRIVQDSLLIYVNVDENIDISKLSADSITLSSYATILPGKGDINDFSQPVSYTVTAEDGTTVVYQVIVSRQASNTQLENSQFEDWYTPSGKSYQEPGKDENTIWASGNAGVVTLGQANTLPKQLTSSDLAAEMITRDLGALAQLTGQRMAAATLFTGKFILDISNPLNSTKFGISFTGRPKSVQFDYTYSPGSPYQNGKGQILSKNDSCDIYVLLENRTSTPVKRIATGWFRNGTTVNSITNQKIDLIYGPIPANSPAYQFPKNGGIFGTGSEPITHITVVFASSAYGDVYEGGVNSKLIVNNFQMNF